MTQVFCRIQLQITEMPKFWAKLKRFIGHYRIEAQSFEDSEREQIMISFYTDKIKFAEGERKQVDFLAKRNDKGSWYFIDMQKW